VFLIHLIDILRFYFFSWDIKLEAAYFLINNIWNGLNAVHASKILTIEANFIIAILLVLVLGWRESLIVTFTVPAILAITLFVAYLTGQTINRITLFAFLLSLGLLVDAAIIVIVGGILNTVRKIHTKKNNSEMVFATLTDYTDEIDLVVFPSMYSLNKNLWEQNQAVLIKGKLQTKDQNLVIIVEKAISLNFYDK